MIEKRKEIRTLKKILVCFSGEGFSVYSNTKDVSPHGVFISTQYLLTEGSVIQIQLDQEVKEKHGKVVWVSSKNSLADIDSIGFGVEFIS